MTTHDDAKGSLHDVLRDDVRSIVAGPGDAAGPDAKDLRAIAPRPVPSVVLSIGARHVQEIARLLQTIPERLDDIVARFPVKIEVRADRLGGFSERMTGTALVLQLGVPIVLTLRSRAEGGFAALTEPERQRFFLAVVSGLRHPPPPGSLLDVEAAAVAADPQGWGQVFAAARERGFHIMLSHHQLDGSPSDAASLLPGEGFLDETPGAPALVWKSATRVATLAEELAVLAALREGNRQRRRAVVMGMGSATTRLLAPFFGAPLVYASVEPGAGTAPGQLPFDALVRTWSRWGIEVDDDGLVHGDEDQPPPRWVLLGRPAWQSLSPAMHNAAARHLGLAARYLPFEPPTGSETPVRDILLAARDLGIVAGNATVPFKRELAEAADRTQGAAKTLGVANTFWFDDGRLVADNTDVLGIQRALGEAGTQIAGAKALILGSGGSAVAAAHAMADASRCTVANRTRAHAEALVKQLGANTLALPWGDRAAAARKADVIIHCTTLGSATGPAPNDSPLPADALKGDKTVLDLVYTPRETPLLRDAAAAGARAVDGLGVLLHQGAAAFRLWTRQEAPMDVMRTAIERAGRLPAPIIGRPDEAEAV